MKCSYSRLLAALALTASMSVALPAAADSLRCGTQLLGEGDSGAELLARCGEPVQVEQKSILAPPVIWRAGRPYRVPGGSIEVRVEFWTYNFGPNKLMRRVRLEDGEVKEIETLSYGY